MIINIVTIFPEYFESFFKVSIIKKAILKGKVEFRLFNIRDYSLSKTKRVDDHPLGGGAGLVMQLQPILDCLRQNNLMDTYKILLAADAPLYTQDKAIELSKKDEITLICGHYEGIDSRIIHYVDEKISIGDYVLTGGEASSLIVADSIVRLIDGVITKDSTNEESYNDNLLEYDQFTYPTNYEGHEVPDYLLKGNHKTIKSQRRLDALNKTKRIRPDLYKKHIFTKEDMKLLNNYKKK